MDLYDKKGLITGLILLIISCKTTTPPFGETTIDYNNDSTLSKQQILRIRSLPAEAFDSGTFAGKEKIEIKFRLFSPKLTKADNYPLVVVFHGSGAVGTDNISQLGVIQKLFATPAIQKKYPAFILAPQFATRSSDYLLDSTRKVLTSEPRFCLKTVLQLIDSLKDNLNIDKNKIYVVGFSMGGSTVINALSARPDLFAAGVSISGIPQFDKIKELTSIPIWLIHGIDDTENTIDSDLQFYSEIKNNKVRFWKLKGRTHDNIFTAKILCEALPKWLFKHSK